MRAKESYNTAMVAIDGFQSQEVNIVLEQIYKMIDESAKNGLFNLYIMKQLKIYWDKQAIEQPKEKKKKWFLVERLI